jgi:hypothetical protein
MSIAEFGPGENNERILNNFFSKQINKDGFTCHSLAGFIY